MVGYDDAISFGLQGETLVAFLLQHSFPLASVRPLSVLCVCVCVWVCGCTAWGMKVRMTILDEFLGIPDLIELPNQTCPNHLILKEDLWRHLNADEGVWPSSCMHFQAKSGFLSQVYDL